jgi:hypothetical protein
MVRYQYDAPVQALSPSTRELVYGPANPCEFDGVITLAGPSTFDKAWRFSPEDESGRRGAILFLDWLNLEKGGLVVGNKTYGMRAAWVGYNSPSCTSATCTKQQSTLATAYAIRRFHADFAINQYSSTYVGYTAKQSYAEGKVLVTWGSTSTAVHSQNNLTFGTLTPAAKWYLSTIDAILAVASEVDSGIRNSSERCPAPTCRQRLKFGFVVTAGSGYARGMCGPAAARAVEGGAAVVLDPSNNSTLLLEVSGSHSVEEAEAALSQLRDAGANVLIACMTMVSAKRLAEARETIDWSPVSVSALVSSTGESWLDDMQAGWWQGENWQSPTGWAPASERVGGYTGMRAKDFASRYRERFGTETSGNAAAAFASFSALAYAIEEAGTLDTRDVAAALVAADFPEFYGYVKYDENGQSNAPMVRLFLLQCFSAAHRLLRVACCAEFV